jgi:zinc/manganese transport system permease protein
MPFHGFFGPALLAGSSIAAASGLIGYFVVLRVQVFAGDALSHVAFTGALAAAAAGIDLRLGLFAATVGVAVLLGIFSGPSASRGAGGSASADDTAIGMVFVWVLGLGALFLYLFNSGASGSNGTIAARTLFGSIFSLTASEAWIAAAVGAAVAAGLLAIARPLLFSSIDPPLAAAAGVPVRALGFAFLALLGLDAAEATQAVGALLLLGLLAAPAAAAHRLTANPWRGLSLSALIAVVAMWAGLALSWWIAPLSPGAAVVLVAVAFYAAVAALGRVRPRLCPRVRFAEGPR